MVIGPSTRTRSRRSSLPLVEGLGEVQQICCLRASLCFKLCVCFTSAGDLDKSRLLQRYNVLLSWSLHTWPPLFDRSSWIFYMMSTYTKHCPAEVLCKQLVPDDQDFSGGQPFESIKQHQSFGASIFCRLRFPVSWCAHGSPAGID